jgi:hypothetical protein|eukprot:scaffold550_cov220-Chaetoceros_neogracile.AAC.4
MKFFTASVLIIIASIAISSHVAPCNAFIGGPASRFEANPNLSKFAEAHSGILLNIGLDIPKDIKSQMMSQSRLCVQDLTLELQTDQIVNEHVLLPGSNGPIPTSSTGPLSTKTHAEGRFVSMEGTQYVNFAKGCWEMVWLKDKPAGSIVCGFELAQEVSRNGAVLPAGGVYINFPIFTRETLGIAKEKKVEYDTRFRECKDLQVEELEKMELTSNFIKKAIHFRNACAANEKKSIMKTNIYDNVPTLDEDILCIGDDLLLCKEGTVWTKSLEDRGTKRHTLVGTASVKFKRS